MIETALIDRSDDNSKSAVEFAAAKGGMAMCYVCGKTGNKIVHSMGCRYVKMMSEKNKKYFNSLKEAFEAGDKQCKYCAYINKYLKKEEKELERFCRPNGVYYYYNPSDGSLDVISHSGKWKIIVNGQKNYIWLYHKNSRGSNYRDFVPGYHSQRIHSSSLMGYMRYIVEHDKYRENNPLYERQKHTNTVKGSKKWKKDQRRAEQIRRKQSIRYVNELLENMARGNIAY